MEAFLGTERGEATFGEARVPCSSHQRQLLTVILPINSEHLTKHLAVESLDLI